MECISKGKATTPYEFGVKLRATTVKEGLVFGMRSIPDNPYDDHTLAERPEQMASSPARTRDTPTAIVDKVNGAWRSTACASCARGNDAASPEHSRP